MLGSHSILLCMVILGTYLLHLSTSSVSSDSGAGVAFLVLAPYPDTGQVQPDWNGGPGVIPAARLAVDRINNRTDILPGYKIELLEGDSGCQHESKSAYSFVSGIFDDTTGRSSVVGVIGPSCSESALLLGSLGARDSVSIIQISPSATSPQMTDIEKYPNTFRTRSTSLLHINAVTELMAHNSWENVVVLHDNIRTYFRLAAEDFLDEYSSKIGFHSEIDSTNYPLGNIEAKYKVIVLLAWRQFAREVMCLAYHRQPQLIYPVYQWIIVDLSKDQLLKEVNFMYNERFYSCSEDMMERAIEGTIFTSYRVLNRENHHQSTDVDLTYEQYQDLYTEYLDKHLHELDSVQRDYDGDAREYAVSYYDATWALALAINASLGQLSDILAEYKHGHPETTSIIRKHLSHLQFEGLMGRIAFRNSTHDSRTPLNINQPIDGINTLIGVYNGTELYIFPNKGHFVLDTFHQSVIGVHQGVTMTVLIIVAICTLYTLCLHVMFVIFGTQNQKSVKAASVTLSHFMFSGCYLILLRVLLIAVEFSYGWQTTSEDEVYNREVVLGVICNVNEWLNSIGISLVMGTLCGKSWRIYRLFNHFTTKRYLVSDVTLTFFIVGLVSVNVILLVVWATVDPLLAVFEQKDIEYNGEDEPVILLRVFCRCEYFSIWISLAYTVILLEVTGVVVLSLLNRRVNRRHFKTAKSVNLMIYLIALSCFVGIGLAFVFESLDIHYTYVSWQFSLLSIVCLVCVFMFSPPAISGIKGKVLCLVKFCNNK